MAQREKDPVPERRAESSVEPVQEAPLIGEAPPIESVVEATSPVEEAAPAVEPTPDNGKSPVAPLVLTPEETIEAARSEIRTLLDQFVVLEEEEPLPSPEAPLLDQIVALRRVFLALVTDLQEDAEHEEEVRRALDDYQQMIFLLGNQPVPDDLGALGQGATELAARLGMPSQEVIPCPLCKGEKTVHGLGCPTCRGWGQVALTT